jgi:uncharacterized cupredoxin-like copper-binding protein
MIMKKLLSLGMIYLISAILLTGCGGSDLSKPVSSLSVEMSEFKFTPTSMTVFANQEINLHLSNTGAVEHDFTILKKGKAAATPFDREKQAADILIDFKLGANQNGDYKFTLPEPGDYTVICAIQGHMESGMVARISAVSP